MTIRRLALDLVLTATVLFTNVCTQNCSDICIEEMAKLRLEDIKMRLLNSMGMQEPPNVDSIDLSPSTIEEMLEALGENDKIEHDQEEKTFIMAVDPSDGIDPDMLVARFPVSLTTMVRKVSRAYLHVYLHVSNGPLPEPEIVTVVVRERLLNGDIGDVVATNPVEIQRSGKAVLPLKSSDVERWWKSEPILGLYVVAMLNGENIAVHPQQDHHERHTMFMSVILASDAKENEVLLFACLKIRNLVVASTI